MGPFYSGWNGYLSVLWGKDMKAESGGRKRIFEMEVGMRGEKFFDDGGWKS
jgi:hypothetical protein